MIVRVLATMAIAGLDGVELDPETRAPRAFRIWRPGTNVTDHGKHVFTEESARRLLAQQAKRGNLISIDVDHLSLNEKAPPESRKAVGWLRLDARPTAAGAELWAVDVQWTDAVRSGLTKDPPEWRYFSPAYDVSKESGEIVSFLNLALTNNPATHHVTALSTRRIAANRESDMKIHDIIAAMYGDDEEKKKEATAALAAMSDDDRKKCKESIAAATKAAFGDDEPPKDDKDKGDKEGKKETKASDTPADEKNKGEMNDKRTAASRTNSSGDATVLATLGEQERRIQTLETERESSKRASILASRPDLTESQRKFLEGKPVAEIEGLLSQLVPPTTTTASASMQSSVRATQGARAEGGSVRAARLPPGEHSKLTERFGRTENRVPHWEGNEFVLPQISSVQAKAILARHAKDYGSDPNVPMRSTSWLPDGVPADMGELRRDLTTMIRNAQVQS